MARYVDELKADLKSVAASGWGAELIPADELLQSQFPELVEELVNKRARREELEALFAAADDEDFEDDEDSGVMPGSEVKRLKEEAKALAVQLKAMAKEAKTAAVDLAAALSRHVHSSVLKLGGTLSEPDSTRRSALSASPKRPARTNCSSRLCASWRRTGRRPTG